MNELLHYAVIAFVFHMRYHSKVEMFFKYVNRYVLKTLL